MNTIPAGNMQRFISITGFVTGTGSGSVVLKDMGGLAIPNGKILWVTDIFLSASDTGATLPKTTSLALTDGLGIPRVATQIVAAPDGALTISASGDIQGMHFTTPVPFAPADNVHPPVMTISGALTSTTTMTVNGSGFYTDNPPGTLPVAGDVV